jgi:thiol-disulfide isomerase/thioredoxin
MRVLVLTQDHCGFCDQAHEVLHRLAADYGFEVATIDIGSPEGQQLAERGGVLFPPGLFLDGEPFSYGRLSERKLRRELDRRSRTGDQGATTEARGTAR